MRLFEGGARFVMRIRGRDHIDLLHRITSNEVKGLAVGDENVQCLLNARGKIIVPFRLRRETDHCILTAPLELREICRDTLDRYIFSEDVIMEFMGDLPEGGRDEDERIRRCELRWGVDIDAETIPWEANMNEYVSTGKGCYTGQEVIARIETYGDAPRHLRLLATQADAPRAGEVMHEDNPAGRITSLTEGRDGSRRFHALAMLKKSVAPGMTVRGDENTTWAVLESPSTRFASCETRSGPA